jgi:nucleoside-diphosphate-sugar epimerase
MSRTVALTGATGFIGSRLARILRQAGWQVRALVRPLTGTGRLADLNVTWVTGTLEDSQSLTALVTGADAVVHCAGAVRGAKEADFRRVNVTGVERIVTAARRQSPAPHFLLISSLAAREPQLSAYAASKRDGERALQNQAGTMPWVILRPPAVYGPGDREILPMFRWMMRGIAFFTGPGSARFSLLYVDDLATAVACLLEQRDNVRGATFELHDGRQDGYSWNDIVSTVRELRRSPVIRVRVPLLWLKLAAALNEGIARLFSLSPMLTLGKIRELSHPDWVASNQAIYLATGWQPSVPLEQGLCRTLDLPTSGTSTERKRP